MMKKKIVLAAINAKYIHSNLAVYSLKSYAQACFVMPGSKENKESKESAGSGSCTESDGPYIEIAEYTINQQEDAILEDLYKRQPDMLCFSCYIWNISMVEDLIRETAKILPDTEIWLGGPEVSFDAPAMLEQFPEVKGIMKGEGEETFAALVSGENKSCLKGIAWRNEKGEIEDHPWREVMDLDRVPFVYGDMKEFEHKIIYYESSRGCPFSCSYCLSSVDKKLRFRSLELVKQELQFFLEHKVPQVKFVDRTFNCSHRHAMEIWKYIREHDNGVTNFHFEISADLLTEEEIELMGAMRPGLIQLEIGVQSTNPDTIREIHRTMQFDKVAEKVKKIQKNHNIHQHLDLIAGLPGEDLASFSASFDDVYRLHPDQLQLGFLKVLKGSFMETRKKDYRLVCKSSPPYEVLSTKWLSYADILILKGVEEMVEVYYNSGQFTLSIECLEKNVKSPFDLYRNLAEFYERKRLNFLQHSRPARYQIFLSYIEETFPEEKEKFRECLIFDYYLRENAKSRPEFAGEYLVEKEAARLFYEREEKEHIYLPHYMEYDRNQMRRMTHLEYFPLKGRYILFDYSRRDPLTKDALWLEVKVPERIGNGSDRQVAKSK